MSKIHFSKFEIHGHRGYRGLYPENTLLGFQKALELGVDAVELDVCVCADGNLLVSHEAYMRGDICLDARNREINPEDEKQHNIYQMSLAEAQAYDCGLKTDKRFPEQKSIPAYKPSLQEVLDSVGFPAGFKYNIEIKSEKKLYGLFQPHATEFARIVYAFIQKNELKDKAYFQSFDPEVLRELHRLDKGLCLSFLTEKAGKAEQQIEGLGFIPDVYAPLFTFVDEETVAFTRSRGIKLIPWTVNEREDMMRLKALGVDGLISDYPERGL